MSQAIDHLSGWPHAEPPFHAGEQAMQARAGVLDRMSQVGPRVIRGAMPDQHRELFEKLPFMLMGALDEQRRPWATLLVGPPGFVRAPDAVTLDIGAWPSGRALPSLQLAAGDPVGLLGLEPATRRRNRANGVIDEARPGQGLRIGVRQSFGNCPKYIQAREPRFVAGTAQTPLAFAGRLPAAACALIEQADTLFIATASRQAGLAAEAAHDGVDVSHRGGKPGFVHIGQEAGHTVLTAPDFIGNFFFNTLGNIAAHPWAGLLFMDWATGDVLMLTGRASVDWDGPMLQRFEGAQRLLRVVVEEGRWLPGAMPLRASGVDQAPQLAATGAW